MESLHCCWSFFLFVDDDHFCLLMMSTYFDLFTHGFKMGTERYNLEDDVGDLAYGLVDFVGKFCSMEAHWWGLEERGWSRWVEEDDAVLIPISHFSWESGRFL